MKKEQTKRKQPIQNPVATQLRLKIKELRQQITDLTRSATLGIERENNMEAEVRRLRNGVTLGATVICELSRALDTIHQSVLIACSRSGVKLQMRKASDLRCRTCRLPCSPDTANACEYCGDTHPHGIDSR